MVNEKYYLCNRFKIRIKWKAKNIFEKVMLDYNRNRKGRSLRKYCKDEAVDYDWLIQYKKNYPLQEKQQEPSQDAFNGFIQKL